MWVEIFVGSFGRLIVRWEGCKSCEIFVGRLYRLVSDPAEFC